MHELWNNVVDYIKNKLCCDCVCKGGGLKFPCEILAALTNKKTASCETCYKTDKEKKAIGCPKEAK